MAFKPVYWLGDSRRVVRSFPARARYQAGFQLWEIQQGNEPSDWKPMPIVGAGVREIRIHVGTEYRILYVATYPEAVYILHAFEKRTRRSPKADIELAHNRYRALIAYRKR